MNVCSTILSICLGIKLNTMEKEERRERETKGRTARDTETAENETDTQRKTYQAA